MTFKVSEEEQRYFAEKEIKERKEREQRRKSDEEFAEIRKGLAEVVQIEDEDILDDIIALGFDVDTVGVLPIVPLIAVAWADGEVQTRERDAIMDLASKRGLTEDSPAYKTLSGLLDEEPTSEYLHSCIYVLREIYDTLAPSQTKRAKTNLINFTQVVAQAAGGVFGLFGNKVSDQEAELIEKIAEGLGISDSETAEKVHSIVSTPVERKK